MAVYRQHSGGVWSCVSYEKQLYSELTARIGLCEIEQSREAAFFLCGRLVDWIPRRWMLREWKILLKAFKVIASSYGFMFAFKLFIFRIVSTKKIHIKEWFLN